MGLSVQMAIKKNRLVVRLDGELDQSNVEVLKKKVCTIIKKYSIVNLVFNFENLTFMNININIKKNQKKFQLLLTYFFRYGIMFPSSYFIIK